MSRQKKLHFLLYYTVQNCEVNTEDNRLKSNNVFTKDKYMYNILQ